GGAVSSLQVGCLFSLGRACLLCEGWGLVSGERATRRESERRQETSLGQDVPGFQKTLVPGVGGQCDRSGSAVSVLCGALPRVPRTQMEVRNIITY
ncbi:hypothetical protein FKM82_025710, partial [Ascaphus truei]